MATQTLDKFFTVDGSLKETLDAFDEANLRTTFKQASDPIYLAFNYVDSRPLSELAKEFIEDSANDLFSFLGKFFS